MKRTLLILLVLSLPLIDIAQATTVTFLEAIHVAEKHTGRTATEWSIRPLQGVDHVVVSVPEGGRMSRFWIHGTHGRVSKIEALYGDDVETIFRWPGVRVVAHRGGAELGPPENTLAAFEKAIEVGADLIEIDIRETKDGHLVIMHDATVDRTTNGTGRVEDLTLEYIRSLDAGSWAGEEYKGLKVPTLRESLELMKGRIDPDLDFKAGDIENLIDVVNEVGIAEKCTHCGPWERCERLRNLEPRIRIRPTIDYPKQIPLLIERLHPPIINMDWHAVTEESFRLAHLAGAEAFVNCLGKSDTPEYARYCAENGADYIQSDRPDRVVEILDELGLRYDPDVNER